MTSSPPDPLLQGALALHRMGNLRAAMDGYMKVLTTDPKNADALYYVAVVGMQEGNFGDCVKLCQRALSVGGEQARVHNLLGQAQIRLGQVDDALASYARAVALQPDFADAYGNRANILALIGQPLQALADFDRALAIRDNSYEDWSNRGAALQDLDRTDEALVSYDRAVALRPDFAGGHYNRGNALRDRAQMEDARAAAAGQPFNPAAFDPAVTAYTKAIQLDPKLNDAYLGRAVIHLLRGDWEQGFRDFEHRTKVGKPTFLPLPDPQWKGEPLPDKRLVLLTEQGLGDTIMMCRYAPVLAARGYDVTILAKKAMQPLLTSLPGVKVAGSTEELAEDPRPIRWIPLMSVPGILGITPQSIPADIPYLTAQDERRETWASRIGRDGFKIGINWTSGHSDNLHFVKRNIPLNELAPLLAIPNVRLFSLQKGPGANQLALISFYDRVTVLNTDRNPDADFFLDTAAAMEQLDLIVTCDTSVAHLAGALGRPVFTALPMIADWRWLLTRSDTPWYPTMKLFRQSAPGQWSDVIVKMVQAIQLKTSNGRASSPPPANR